MGGSSHTMKSLVKNLSFPSSGSSHSKASPRKFHFQLLVQLTRVVFLLNQEPPSLTDTRNSRLPNMPMKTSFLIVLPHNSYFKIMEFICISCPVMSFNITKLTPSQATDTWGAWGERLHLRLHESIVEVQCIIIVNPGCSYQNRNWSL